MRELISAAEGVLPYLKSPEDDPFPVRSVTLEYRPIPTALEEAKNEVVRLEAQAAAIKRFREALKKITSP